ncbi:kinase-like domain-containing protein [Cercophora newfieldiana]|uniref:Kinase-like domain-containing protein n=1 Tax=Cercophora newfieldiana TaxID=92897 RepID=A0AA40D015_9PEZI|nr:kinase-like domain-containing protein [Cercophora newfieldiana]
MSMPSRSPLRRPSGRGGSTKTRGRRSDISANEGVQILCQLLSALAYLHEHDPPIVHRDIKPDNILVQHRHAGDIYVKFGDFGLSRESRDPTTVCGTLRYAAPEIHSEMDRRNARRKKRSYTLAVDI